MAPAKSRVWTVVESGRPRWHPPPPMCPKPKRLVALVEIRGAPPTRKKSRPQSHGNLSGYGRLNRAPSARGPVDRGRLNPNPRCGFPEAATKPGYRHPNHVAEQPVASRSLCAGTQAPGPTGQGYFSDSARVGLSRQLHAGEALQQVGGQADTENAPCQQRPRQDHLIAQSAADHKVRLTRHTHSGHKAGPCSAVAVRHETTSPSALRRARRSAPLQASPRDERRRTVLCGV